jgi:hypothetical protein
VYACPGSPASHGAGALPPDPGSNCESSRCNDRVPGKLGPIAAASPPSPPTPQPLAFTFAVRLPPLLAFNVLPETNTVLSGSADVAWSSSAQPPCAPSFTRLPYVYDVMVESWIEPREPVQLTATGFARTNGF